MKDIFKTIVSNSFTTTDLYHRLALAREFSDLYVYRKSGGSSEARSEVLTELDQFLVSKNEKECHVVALREWGEGVWMSLTTGSPTVHFRELERLAEGLQVIVLYLPHELPQSELDDVGEWFRREIGETVLLDVRYSRSVVGGCAFSIHGYFYDYSFRSRIAPYHGEILKMVKEGV